MENNSGDQIGATIEASQSVVVGKGNHQQVVHVGTREDLRYENLEHRVLILEIDRQIRDGQGKSGAGMRVLFFFSIASIVIALAILAVNIYVQVVR